MATIPELERRKQALQDQQSSATTTERTVQSGSSELQRRMQASNLSTPSQDLQAQRDAWNELPLQTKLTNVFQEVPNVLYNFIPQKIRDYSKEPAQLGTMEGFTKPIEAGVGGGLEFIHTIAKATAEGIVGAGIEGYEAVTGKKNTSLDIPLIGEIKSYSSQVEMYKQAGFSDDEAKGLVGINAYLSVIPFVGAFAKTKAGAFLNQQITTTKVPFSQTPAGIKSQAAVNGAIQNHIVTAKTILRETPPADFAKNGGTSALLNRTKINIVDGLKAEGFTKASDAISKIDLTTINNIDDLARSVTSVLDDATIVPDIPPMAQFRPRIAQLGERSKAVDPVPMKIDEAGIARIERPIVTNAKTLVGATDEQRFFNELQAANKERFYEAREAILSREDPLNAALLKLTKEELNTYADISQGLVSAAKDVSKNLREAIELNRKLNIETEADLINRGIFTAEQIENRKWIPLEITTGRTRAELQGLGIEPLYYPYLAEGKLSRADFVAATGRRTKGSYQRRFTGKLLAENNYIRDPKIAIPRHRIQVLKDKMSAEFVQDVANNLAEQNPVIIRALNENPGLARFAGLKEWKPAGNLRFYPVKTAKGTTARAVSSKVESYWVPETIAKELDNVFRPGIVEKILRATYDPVIDLWRIGVLNMMPRWIYNNVVGNFILSTSAGTSPLAYLAAAGDAIARTKIGKILGLSEADLPKGVRSREYGGGEGSPNVLVTDTNFTHLNRPIENWLAGLELANRVPVLRLASQTTTGIIKAWMALGKPGAALNNIVENFFRTAVFLSKRDGVFLNKKLELPKAEADAVGLKHVNEFLNDYSKLTRNERVFMRRVLPFWNWMKFITKFSLLLPAKHPLRARIAQAVIQDYVDFINMNQAEDKEKSVFRIKTDMVDEKGKPMYINVKSAIPFSDVIRTLPVSWEAAKTFMSSNPVSKIFIEQAFRINTFTGQPFTAPPGVQKKDQYGNVIQPTPDLLEHILQQFPQTDIVRDLTDYISYGAVLKRYDTGEYKLVNGRLQTADITQEVLKYFGISLSAFEVNKIKRMEEIEQRVDAREGEIYNRQLQKRLEKLKEQYGAQESMTPEEIYQQKVNEAFEETDGFLQRFFKAIPAHLISQTQGFLSDPAAFYGAIAQGTAQIPVNIGLAATGEEEYVPTTPLEKFLLGDRPIPDVFGVGREVLVASGETNEDVLKKWGPALGVMLTASNFIPVGPKGASVTTRTASRLEASVTRPVVNRQVVDDLLKNQDVNKFERAVHTQVLDEMTANTAGNINVKDYIDRVNTQLLTLAPRVSITKEHFAAIAQDMSSSGRPDFKAAQSAIDASGKFVRSDRYANTYNLPREKQGNVIPGSYEEIIFESPYEFTSSHFVTESKNYFAHVRSDKVKEGPTLVYRDLEWQSDLFQKGRLRREFETDESYVDSYRTRQEEALGALSPFEKFWPERIAAERVRSIAAAGGGKYRIATGDTARLIERHQGNAQWAHVEYDSAGPHRGESVTPESLKVGKQIAMDGSGESWVVTEVLPEGKFRAIQRSVIDDVMHDMKAPSRQYETFINDTINDDPEMILNMTERFDLSKEFNYDSKINELKALVDRYGPNDQSVKQLQAELEVYRFYEKEIPKMFSKSHLSVSRVTDPQGIEWWETEIAPDPNMTVGAYGFLPPAVRNAKYKAEPPRGFVSPKMIMAGAAGVSGLTGLMEALAQMRSYKFENPNEAETVPEIIEVREDDHGEYFVLPDGVDVRPIDDKELFKDMYKDYPRVPKGMLEAVYMQESSAGTNDAHRKYNAGKFGWLVGFTKGTLEDLKKRKDDPRVAELLEVINFDNEPAALRSMAAYLEFRMDMYNEEGQVDRVIDDPERLYFGRYNVGSDDSDAAHKAFMTRYNYYKTQ